MGNPGTYKQELPDMPDSLNTFRNHVHSVLIGEMTQNEASYPGPGGSNMALDPPDYLDDLRGYAANWVAVNPTDAIWDLAEDALEDMLVDGEPVDAEDWYDAAKTKVEQELEGLIPDINEAALVGGMRYGTGVLRAHTEEITKRYAEMGLRYVELEIKTRTDAKNRILTAADIATRLGDARTRMRIHWVSNVLAAGVSDWMAKIQAEQLRYQDFMNRRFSHRPTFNAATAYALGYPFQGQNPVITPNPWTDAGMGILQAGAAIGAAAIMASAKEFKDDISPISEKGVHDAILRTKVHSWCYHGEDIRHMGPLANSAPHFMSTGYGIYIADYVAALHATIQHMDKRIKELENAIH